jgi:hypothetical protein
MAEYTKPTKPLGIKSYGSIGHLPTSRRGPADFGVPDGQAVICTTKARDKHDIIIVQEKLDGSNVGVCKVNGCIVAMNRAGYPAMSSPYEQHHHWARWVELHADRFDSLLTEGERVCGEWLMQAHGTRYLLYHEPFVAFDIMRGHERALHSELCERLGDFQVPATIHKGGPLSIDDALRGLGEYGFYGAMDPIEGAVWRVERNGKVDFLAKYVKPFKVDGCYLPEISGKPAVFNWLP